ncbi:major facilitator superfamily transporter [Ameyamaea chiangmaiensis NBRC 103196]|uniref:MFS transporter n=1 Tax=Ameyamaea chiangmaiensis TaxID=442969 RepID=A0A850PAV4_9PROT|nr:MFS transporter [Ameyamaea chiangmaiensis]MBS4076044.1 MFS transporter [Ameyamaea chiangmaiensis]NVN39819.1 MFS transporter [Ameyamaea chiangmaiensis]GBQ66807.1 major facilitator superfamily transporter [Ameyamaea chiangmaiensis NBRC 103196]
MESGIATQHETEDRIFRRVALRILPFLIVCYVVAYMDRVNVSLAKLQMLGDLKMSDTAFGLGAGIFFVGYFLCEVPSNLAMHKVGARFWIARIMVTWGVIAAGVAFIGQIAAAFHLINATVPFLTIRFLLGAAEAGFFPGLVLYLNYWFPTNRQGRVFSILMAAQPLSFVIGLPIAGWLMEHLGGVWGVAGWRWMIAAEALPAIILGGIVLLVLDDRPREAAWLSSEDCAVVEGALAAERDTKADVPVLKILSIPTIWVLTVCWFLIVVGVYGINFWLPTLIHNTGIQSNQSVGLLSAVPYIGCAIGMVCFCSMAEKLGLKTLFIAGFAVLSGVSLIASAYWGMLSIYVTLICMTAAMIGSMTSSALFWSLPGEKLTGRAAAAGIAAINSIGNLGGFCGPTILGILRDHFGSDQAGLVVLGCCLILSGVIALLFFGHGKQSGTAACRRSSHASTCPPTSPA